MFVQNHFKSQKDSVIQKSVEEFSPKKNLLTIADLGQKNSKLTDLQFYAWMNKGLLKKIGTRGKGIVSSCIDYNGTHLSEWETASS